MEELGERSTRYRQKRRGASPRRNTFPRRKRSSRRISPKRISPKRNSPKRISPKKALTKSEWHEFLREHHDVISESYKIPYPVYINFLNMVLQSQTTFHPQTIPSKNKLNNYMNIALTLSDLLRKYLPKKYKSISSLTGKEPFVNTVNEELLRVLYDEISFQITTRGNAFGLPASTWKKLYTSNYMEI